MTQHHDRNVTHMDKKWKIENWISIFLFSIFNIKTKMKNWKKLKKINFHFIFITKNWMDGSIHAFKLQHLQYILRPWLTLKIENADFSSAWGVQNYENSTKIWKTTLFGPFWGNPELIAIPHWYFRGYFCIFNSTVDAL